MNLSDLIKTNSDKKINSLDFRMSETGSTIPPEEVRALGYIETLTLKTRSELMKELLLTLKEIKNTNDQHLPNSSY